MTAAIIAPIDNLALVAEEIETLVTILQKKFTVSLFQYSVNEKRLSRELDRGSVFEFVWVASHSTENGIVLSDGELMTTGNFARWLLNVDCRTLILNSCFSAALITEIQNYVNVEIIATIGVHGIEDNAASISASFLASCLMKSSSTQDAVQKASGNGATPYRYFPKPKGELVDGTQFSKLESTLARQGRAIEKLEKKIDALEDAIDPVVRIVRGDPDLNHPPLAEQIRALRQEFVKRPTLEVNWWQLTIIFLLVILIIPLLIFIVTRMV